MIYKRALIVILSVSMIACSTVRYINDVSYHTVKQHFKPGDDIVLVDSLGNPHNLKISQIVDDRLYGYDGDMEVSFSYSQISKIQYKEFSGGKTAGAGAATVITLLVIAAAMLIAGQKMFESSRDSD